MPFHALVIGASSTIAQAAIQAFENDPLCEGVFAVSRSGQPSQNSAKQNDLSSKTQWLTSDYSEQSIRDVCRSLLPRTLTSRTPSSKTHSSSTLVSKKSSDEASPSHPTCITKVLICNGILHDEKMMPEKKIEDVNADQLERTLYANTITPMLWLSHLLPVLTSRVDTQVAVFSARVGSISDNKMGGWYSYRASKAALNMLIKNSAIEYARRAKNVKLIAFHPGTTDTPLSKPFQRSVPEGKLFKAEFVASQLLTIMQTIPMNNEASFLDWKNTDIEW